MSWDSRSCLGPCDLFWSVILNTSDMSHFPTKRVIVTWDQPTLSFSPVTMMLSLHSFLFISPSLNAKTTSISTPAHFAILNNRKRKKRLFLLHFIVLYKLLLYNLAYPDLYTNWYWKSCMKVILYLSQVELSWESVGRPGRMGISVHIKLVRH